MCSRGTRRTACRALESAMHPPHAWCGRWPGWDACGRAAGSGLRAFCATRDSSASRNSWPGRTWWHEHARACGGCKVVVFARGVCGGRCLRTTGAVLWTGPWLRCVRLSVWRGSCRAPHTVTLNVGASVPLTPAPKRGCRRSPDGGMCGAVFVSCCRRSTCSVLPLILAPL